MKGLHAHTYLHTSPEHVTVLRSDHSCDFLPLKASHMLDPFEVMFIELPHNLVIIMVESLGNWLKRSEDLVITYNSL